MEMYLEEEIQPRMITAMQYLLFYTEHHPLSQLFSGIKFFVLRFAVYVTVRRQQVDARTVSLCREFCLVRISRFHLISLPRICHIEVSFRFSGFSIFWEFALAGRRSKIAPTSTYLAKKF